MNSDRIILMRQPPRFLQLTARATLAVLVCGGQVPTPSSAQPAPPPLPLPYPSQPSQNQGDPPSRVGRVAEISGSVSFHTQGDSQWTPVAVNYPVSSGDSFWTELSAQAQLEISDSRIQLASATEFTLASLDTNLVQLVAAQGQVYLDLHGLDPRETWTVQTPRGLVRLDGDGRYVIVVGSTEEPTRVTVIEGSAEVEGPGLALHVREGNTATIEGTDNFEGRVEPEQGDGVPALTQDVPRPPLPPQSEIPAQVVTMPGGTELARYGSWEEAPDYGQVWYPPVAPGWVPYREGHWAFVAPWGWTWVDDAPWGFAPSHYGRWVEIDGRWAWTPGMRQTSHPPVYAPALVTFLGIGAGVAAGAALASGHIGWVPLGPREPFRPWYHASDRYLRNVNGNHVSGPVNNNFVPGGFVNRAAATSIPAAIMTGSRPVQTAARPVSQQELAAARPFAGQQPLPPGSGTAGITPRVARQFNLPPTAVPIAPGPALQTQAPNLARAGFRPPLPPQSARPAGRFANPAIQPAQMPPGPAPQVVVPSPRLEQPGSHQIRPGLVQPVPAGPNGPLGGPGGTAVQHNREPEFRQALPGGVPPNHDPQRPEPPRQEPPHAVAPPAPLPQIQRPAAPGAVARPEPPRFNAPEGVPHREPERGVGTPHQPQFAAPLQPQPQSMPPPAQQHFAAPPPQQQHSAPPPAQQHFAAPPPPQPQSMPPPAQQHFAAPPPPQPQSMPPPAQQHFAAPPPPQPQSMPPPAQQHFAPPPPPQHFSAPPPQQQHSAPPPSAPPPHDPRRPGG